MASRTKVRVGETKFAVVIVSLSFVDAKLAPEILSQLTETNQDLGFPIFAAQLQGEGPSLMEVIMDLWDQGFTELRLLGVATGTEPLPLSWLRRVAGEACRRASEININDRVLRRRILVADSILRISRETPIEAQEGNFEIQRFSDLENSSNRNGFSLAQQIIKLSQGGYRQVTGKEAGLTNPQWAELPPFRYHLLVCTGPRCNAKQANQVLAQISAELRKRQAIDTEVLVTSCMFPCNSAPTVVVYPDGIWQRVTPAEVPQFIASLLDEE